MLINEKSTLILEILIIILKINIIKIIHKNKYLLFTSKINCANLMLR